jgi:hypothetical protein
MANEQREHLVSLLVIATFCSVFLFLAEFLQGNSTEWVLAVASGLYGGALVGGIFGPTEYWVWPAVTVIQGEATPREVLTNMLQFYGLLSIGFGSGLLLASLVL